MRIKAIPFFLLTYISLSRTNGKVHFKWTKQHVVRTCMKLKKVRFPSSKRSKQNFLIWKNKSRKNNNIFFVNNKDRVCVRNKKENMTLPVEQRHTEVHSLGNNEYNFVDISQRLNMTYWEDKTHVLPPLIQIAPMINVTNRHFRALMRMLTNKAQLWTEMVVDNTLLYNLNNLEQYLGYDEREHPIVCQLGGSDCTRLSEAAVLVEQYGYDEININVGCPSDKVANKGAFGAYLMKQPDHVRNLVYEIKRKVQIPVSVKIRTGIDDMDSFEFLQNFVESVSTAGCNKFIVHARKAWLKGLDPKKNRKIPPLEYKKVFDLCQIYPNLKFTLNGGIQTVEEAVALLNGYMPLPKMQKAPNTGTKCFHDTGRCNIVYNKREDSKTVKKKNINENTLLQSETEEEDDTGLSRTYVKIENYDVNPLYGVMIGRAAKDNTVVLSQVDKLIYNTETPASAHSRRTLLEAYILYLEKYSESHTIVSAFELLKPILGILKGTPGHRVFRNKLDNYIRTYAAYISCSEILEKAVRDVDSFAPGVLDLPLSDRKLHEQYINNF